MQLALPTYLKHSTARNLALLIHLRISIFGSLALLMELRPGNDGALDGGRWGCECWQSVPGPLPLFLEFLPETEQAATPD